MVRHAVLATIDVRMVPLLAVTTGDWYTRLLVIVLVFVVATILVRVANAIIARAYWGRVLAGQAPEHAAELRRNQRQKSVVSMLQSLVRYVVFGAALGLALVLISERAVNALLGASLLVLVVGFGLQRVLADAVAGALLLFERHYSVGDYVVVHQLGVEGIVEEFTVRSTVLRAINGNRIVVMNSAIAGCTRYAQASRSLRIECIVRIASSRAAIEAAQLCTQATASPNHHFLRPPEVIACEALDVSDHDSCTRVELFAVVPPTQEWLVDSWMVDQMMRMWDERVISTINVIDVSESALSELQGAALVAEAI